MSVIFTTYILERGRFVIALRGVWGFEVSEEVFFF